MTAKPYPGMPLNDYFPGSTVAANTAGGSVKLVVGATLPAPKGPLAKAQTVPRVVGKMNQTEARYVKDRLEPRRLKGEILRWDYEPVKLRLADNTYLTPDFRIIEADGTEVYDEVKGGFVREDAWIKLKIAAESHPYVFRMAQLRKGAWTIRTV